MGIHKDFRIGFQMSLAGISSLRPKVLTGQESSRSQAIYAGLLAMTTAVALYPLATGQNHPFFYAAADGAIALGALPILGEVLQGLQKGRLGTAFCVSLALTLALFENELAVALTLLVWTLTTRSLEDWSKRRTERILSGCSDFSSSTRGGMAAAPHLTGHDTARWVQDFLVYLALAAAVFASLTRADMKSALAMLVIGSAPALSVSRSLLRLASLRRGSQSFLVTRDEHIVEKLAAANVVILDVSAGIDPFRNTAAAIRLLRAEKVTTVLFTDALEPEAGALASHLGTDKVEAELFPEDRSCKIAAMQQRHCRVVCLSQTMESSLATADVAILVDPDAEPNRSVDAVIRSKDLKVFANVLRFGKLAGRVTTWNCVLFVVVSSAILGLALQGSITAQSAVGTRLLVDLGLAASSIPFFWNRTKASRP